ncbi:MAG: SDR family NAD(P)-dependent oxidoreductase, partial [Acidobacteriota bacterium]|nr:SDR family NAD(P)-dependent oxidoreductase [Acidobacteriota bacterium]
MSFDAAVESSKTQLKVAVVSGAAQGIGRETAELLATRGYSLVLTDLQGCEQTRAAAALHGVKALEVLADISQ